ncbi:bifunctional folylpolyglutamate synthase/dihydrofolate synthase [Flavobacterium okayamense]|uniref:Dihydrofolate synthase/folylpolyglutamate synthase n=1 Tax=Flavobacterium okayamense TaxID=2830782 RepID=A0ABM7S5D3_9FLAO|nr:folylpolyglutamate synthase/dihydrofolate synthase family protein [Flavobacterium okayamense]BCY28241.1 tetrahydrofolate synthase [Flavobacterium okayamense]
MNYKETTEWMFGQLPMYQNQGAKAYKADLTNTLALVNHLNNPQKYFKSVHVAGTNGKGSVSSMLASILQEAGYKVGLFTSPHFKDFRERIKINGNEIKEQFVVDFVEKNKDFFDANSLSFFEMTTGMAFSYFAKEKVDVAIIEVGLGGRLDSTNVIDPLVSVITNIGFDHKQFLGNTLGRIAYEKAGIIKHRTPVVVGETIEETKTVFRTIAKLNSSELHIAENINFPDYKCELKGDYQKKNLKTVLTVVSLLQVHFSISKKDVERGLLNVSKNTGLKGRWQVLNEKPFVVCDTAHNEHGLRLVLEQLVGLKYNTLHIVLGVVNDKDLDEILPLFPKVAKYYFCSPNLSRGLDEEVLEKKAEVFGLKGKKFNSVRKAYENALQNAGNEDVVFIGGSTFTVAEVV